MKAFGKPIGVLGLMLMNVAATGSGLAERRLTAGTSAAPGLETPGAAVVSALSIPPLGEASCNTAAAATLFFPQWEVSLNGTTGGDIPPGGVDTIIEVSNASGAGVMTHVSLWNGRGAGILNFNVPIQAGGHVTFSMRDVMNGRLNVNGATQSGPTDRCSDAAYMRFTNPDSIDRSGTVSWYATPAYAGSFRRRVWDALDGTADGSPCSPGTVDGVYGGSLRGSLTIDVVNFCTNYFPTDGSYYVNDALATIWPAGTPNVLVGGTYRVTSSAASTGTLDPLPVEPVVFSSLDWNLVQTFYGAFWTASDALPGPVPMYAFQGDGRTPNPGRHGTISLSLSHAPPDGPNVDVTARAAIRPLTSFGGCPSFGCQVELFGAGGGGPSGGGLVASADPVTGHAQWNLSLPLASGATTLWANTDAGCTACPSCSSKVALFDPAPAVSQVLYACGSGTTMLQAPEIPGATYLWTGPGGFASAERTPLVPVSIAAAGTYHVSATVDSVCARLGDTVVIPFSLLSPTASNGGPACEGQVVQLSASWQWGGSTGYSWTGPNGFTSNLQNPTVVASALTAGTYSVVANGANCQSGAKTTTLVAVPSPSLPSISAPASVAENSSGHTASVESHGGASYSWGITNGTITGGQGSSQISFSVGLTGPVGLTVVETNVAGCASPQAAVSIPFTPVLHPIASPIVVGGTNVFTGTGFTAGSVIKLFVSTASGPVDTNPAGWTPGSWTPTSLTWTIPPGVPLGQGFGSLLIVNTDQGYVTSNVEGQLLYGDASDGLPTILSINGTGLSAYHPSFPGAHVESVLAAGSTVTITGTGFSGPLVNLHTATGNVGPLTPLPGGTATSFQVVIPADAPAGPGTFQVVNSGAGWTLSNAVAAVLRARITVTSVNVVGSTITVTGDGFCALTVVNLFNAQVGGVVNLGGLLPGGAPAIPLTILDAQNFTFALPAGAQAGPAYVMALNPPFTPFTSSGTDPGGAFTVP